MVISTAPSPKHEKIFLWSLRWESAGVPGGKTHENVVDLLRLGPSLRLVQFSNSQRLSFVCFYQLVAPVASASAMYISAVILSVFVSLLDFEVVVCPIIPFSDWSKRSHWFAVCTTLFLWGWVTASKLFTYWKLQWKSLLILRLLMVSWKSPTLGAPPPCSSPDLLLSNLATQLSSQHLVLPSLLFWIHSNIFLVYIFILLQFILIAS